MTYYELLLKVSFDEIATFLSKSYTEGKPLAPFTICAILFLNKTNIMIKS